jgi:PAS domain S-box-containing protein
MINILLVEDDPCDQQLAKWILAKPLQTVEFTIETAGSAKIGLERLRCRSFDLVLLDLALPDSDGLETVETFHNANSKIPVVVLTGLDSEETGLETIKKGAADYLVKGRGIKHQLAKSILYALERKRVEDEMQENERKVRAIFDHTSRFIGLTTPDGILIEANRTALTFAGIKDSDVLGKPFWETPWWTHSTQMQDKLRDAVKAASQGQLVRFEATHKAPDGNIHYIDFSLKPVKDENGNVILLIPEGSDITERKQAEETQKRLVAIIEATPDFVGFADAKDKHIIYVNKAGRKMCGIGDDEDVTKLNIPDVHPEWANKMFAEEILPAAVRDGVWTGECAFLNIRDRHEIPVLMVLSSHKASNGEVEVFSTISRDITERKQAEEVLRASEAKYRILLENLPQKIFFKDRNLVYVSCNDNYARDLKIKAEEIVGRTDYDFYPKELVEKYRADDKRIIETGKTEDIEEKYIQDGQEACVHTVKTSVKDDQGNIIGLLGIFRDITHRKKAEEELCKSEKAAKTACEQLEKANNELKTMHSQMLQSEKLAAIGHLAAGVAHEMNTPVGFVASNFQTLESYVNKFKKLLEMYDELVKAIETSEKTELLNNAETITKLRDTMKMDFILGDLHELFNDSKEGLERVTNIIQNLRDFSRVDQTDSFGDYNINDGIHTTLAVARNAIKYDAEVKTELSEVPVIFCNASQINQVFLNIILNAVQAIRSQDRNDKGTITIRTYATDDEIACEISDDGPGIPAEIIPKIFDPFFTTKPAGKGTGLGLSISYDIIVNKHKGKILVDSTVGKGAKFTIKLPIKTEKENNDEKTENYDEKEECVVSMKTGG